MGGTLDDEIRATIEKLIVLSPFGTLLHAACESIAEDRVRVRLPFRPEVTTLGDLVHGGAVASLVDVAATAAAWASPRATSGAKGTTVGFSLSFLAPARGRDLVADARVVKRGGTLCVIEVSVADPEAAEVARALVTYKLSL